MSGNVEIESTARIDGDVSVVSGRIDRKEGASVGGNVVQGPSFRLPGGVAPGAPGAPDAPGISFGTQSRGFFGTLVYFVGRLFAAALMVALVMLLVGGLFYLRPQMIADARRQMNEQLALSAVVGVLANLTALFLAGLLAITICLLPLALIPLLLLFGVNVVGWAVASQIVGERIVKATKQEVQPSLAILVGAFALTGVSAFLWAMGGCFQFIASLLVFAVSSLGAGAVLVPWINRRRGVGGARNAAGGESSSDDDGGGGAPRGPQPTGPTPSYGADVETDVAAPIDYMTAEEINEAARQPGTVRPSRGSAGGSVTSAAATGGARPFDADAGIDDEATQDQDLTEPIGYVTAEEVNAEAKQASKPRGRAREKVNADDETTQDQDLTAPIGYVTAGEVNDEVEQAPKPRTRSRKREEAGADDEVTQDQDLTEPIGYVTAQEVVTGDVVSEGDDFSQIKGVGPTYARRLKEAGYATFAQLAVATPEEVGAAMGLPADRVRRAEVIDQAKVLARK
jgi:predicted flap endonuclease-1-like 5' DNA nuclease